MSKGIYNVPVASNEEVKSYAPGSPELEELLSTYKSMKNSTIDVPYILVAKKLPVIRQKP